MKIKIVSPGWESFTGYFGVTEFKDGVSVEEVGVSEAQRLAANVSIVTLEGKDPSAAQAIIDSRADEMPIVNTPTEAEAPATIVMPHTREELEEIADKGGIKALREIAEKYGVKGKAITEIVSELLALGKKG